MPDSLIRGTTDTPTPSHSQNEEWTNTLTHGLGLFLSLVGAVILCRQAGNSGNGTLILGSIVYSLSLAGVYLVSTLSHAVQNQSQRFRWRVLDQGFIYLLIAGSYTGFSLPLLSIEKNQYLFGSDRLDSLHISRWDATHGTRAVNTRHTTHFAVNVTQLKAGTPGHTTRY